MTLFEHTYKNCIVDVDDLITQPLLEVKVVGADTYGIHTVGELLVETSGNLNSWLEQSDDNKALLSQYLHKLADTLV